METLVPYLVSWMSYRVVGVCLLSVPSTHVLGMYLRCPVQFKCSRYRLLFPFTGGNRHVVLQLLAWILWSFSLLTFFPVLLALLPGSYRLSKDLPTLPHTHVDMVSGAAACVSFIGELFMIKAILVYDDDKAPAKGDQKAQHLLKPRPVLASAVVVVLGLLLSVTGFLLLMALEYMPDIPSRVLYCCLSLSCLLIASSTTYGLGGFLRYGSSSKGEGGSDDGMWQFFQPFSGGTAFVTTQAISWSMFAATVVLMVVMIQQLVAGVAHCFRCWAISAGTLMVTAQAMLGLSLLLFRSPKSTAAKLVRAASGALAGSLSRQSSGQLQQGQQQHQGWLGANMPVLLMYMPVHFFFTLWALSFVFLPQRVAVAVWIGFLVPYYAFTQWGNPAHTGCRQWPWLMGWFARNIEGSLCHWFGSLTVVYDGDDEALAMSAPAAETTAETRQDKIAAVLGKQQQKQRLSASQDALAVVAEEAAEGTDGAVGGDGDSSAPLPAVSASNMQQQEQEQQQVQQQAQQTAKQQHMFGFQPHGLYPTGAGFLPWMPSFAKHFPGVNPITLTASVIFFPPFIRDICCWAGFRQVSKHTFLAALAERGSVMFCPGGQAEMVHAWRAFLPGPKRELVLHTRHKGFCRIAIEHQARLVPVLALGEGLQLRNLFDLPTLQQYTYKKLGFPVPFILCGRWGITPFPRKTPLVYVVGKPLEPPKCVPGQPVDAAAVEELHRQYYASLVDLFGRYQHLHPDFAQAKVVLTDD